MKEKFYYIKVGNMYLKDIYVYEEAAENEFINNLELSFFNHYECYFKKERAEAISKKIFIVLGVECKLIEFEKEKI